MKKITLLVLALMIGGAAIAKHKHKKKQKAANTNITSVLMHRTACFGRCPEYSIEIGSDGNTIYTGMRFTADTGAFQKKIDVAKAQDIFKQFDTYHVDTCRNVYYNRVEDLPGINLTIKYKDSTKTIRNANFGPGFLRQLATSIDEAGKKTDDSWQKIATPKK